MSALREIIARFGISFDTAELKKGNTALENTIGAVKNFAGALGTGLALHAIGEFIIGLTEEADALAKQSAVLGLSLADMQSWNYAAAMQGVSAEALAASLAKLSGGKYDAASLAKLGVTAKKSGGEMKTSGELLEEVGGALSKIDDPTKRNTLAMGVLGKSYAKLLPLFADGSKGLKELRGEFDALGGGFTDDFAKQADDFGDNLDRAKVIWKGVSITIVGSMLPTLLLLSRRFIEVVKPLVVMIKHSEALKTGAIALGVKGLLVLSKAIGPLGAGFRVLAGHILRTVLPLLILEDALTFLSGGDSMIGRALEKFFGAGSSDKVRAWIGSVKTEFLAFIGSIKSGAILDDWNLLVATLKKDIRQTLGNDFGDVLNSAGGLFLLFIDLLTGGWDNFTGKSAAAWDAYLLYWKIASVEMQGAFLAVVAVIEDAFAGMWNSVLSGAQGALGVVQRAANAVGASDIAQRVGGVISSLESSKGAGDASARASAALSQERLGIASAGDAIGNRLTAGRPDVTNHTEVTVTVPPGTPETMANRVGAAAAAGVAKSNRATYAALNPGKG